jgi:hypothetical protein
MRTTDPQSTAGALENRIRSFLVKGIEMAEEVRGFMEATFGDAGAETLQEILDDTAGSERDSLLDLVFFPDTALQMVIEPLLTAHRVDAADVARLAEGLKRTPAAIRLQMPGGRAVIDLAMPAFAVDAFLTRLNLTWQPASDLTAALEGWDAHVLSPSGDPADGRLRLRVRLRNAALRQTPAQVRFLVAFFERMDPAGEDLVDQIDFALVFLTEHEAADNFYAALMERKRFLMRHLRQARRSAEFAARNNMETLIMTGVRMPYFDRLAAEKALALIDVLAMGIYGRTEWVAGEPHRVDLGYHPGVPDPAELIRRLS